MDAWKIKGIVKDYDWGNRDFIPSLIGGYTGKPQAELWMGSHPSGDCMLYDGEMLSHFLSRNPDIIGKEALEKYGELPFLFKILAIDKPLSLQCHPDKKQAMEGWQREKDRREKGEDCNYQDDNEKAEIIASITPISAMCGFRPFSEIVENFAQIAPVSYEKYLSVFENNKDLFLGLYKLSDNEKKEILLEAEDNIHRSNERSLEGDFLTEKGIFERCASEWPGDIGAIFPYILNVLHLERGEALYLEPDTLHAYVYGNGVELMSASDNVLRGGLTRKRIDLLELERIMNFKSEHISKVERERDQFNRIVYKTPSDAFCLIELPDGTYNITKGQCAIMIVIDGSAIIKKGEEELLLEKGQIALMSAKMNDYMINVDGDAFMAEVPRCNM